MGGGGPSQCRTPTYAPAGGTKRQPASVTAMPYSSYQSGGYGESRKAFPGVSGLRGSSPRFSVDGGALRNSGVQ